MTLEISKSQARSIAIRSIGLGTARPDARGNKRHVRRVLRHVGLIQIDSVNVLARAQEMPLWSRLGDHDRSVLTRMADDGELFEYWGHEASLIPVEDEPLFRWRMRRAADGIDTWGGIQRLAKEQPTLLSEVRARLREDGALTARELRDGPTSTEAWWGWDATKTALEYLLWAGEVSATRGPTFERRYALREVMLPAHVIETPDPDPQDAMRELLRRAGRSHGIGWRRDLADYYRIGIKTATPLLEDLVDEGSLLRCRVEGTSEFAYLSCEARRGRIDKRATLLSPFDPLVWERQRIERLFGFRYRIEIYVPAPKREYGYYVLPFLFGDRIAGRVDLKADRKASALLVLGAFVEDGVDADEASFYLAAELDALRSWLGLDGVEVAPNGSLAMALSDRIVGHVNF